MKYKILQYVSKVFGIFLSISQMNLRYHVGLEDTTQNQQNINIHAE